MLGWPWRAGSLCHVCSLCSGHKQRNSTLTVGEHVTGAHLWQMEFQLLERFFNLEISVTRSSFTACLVLGSGTPASPARNC